MQGQSILLSGYNFQVILNFRIEASKYYQESYIVSEIDYPANAPVFLVI